MYQTAIFAKPRCFIPPLRFWAFFVDPGGRDERESEDSIGCCAALFVLFVLCGCHPQVDWIMVMVMTVMTVMTVMAVMILIVALLAMVIAMITQDIGVPCFQPTEQLRRLHHLGQAAVPATLPQRDRAGNNASYDHASDALWNVTAAAVVFVLLECAADVTWDGTAALVLAFAL